MAKVLITSEYFGRYSGAARERLIEAGHRVADNPYGHKLLTEKEILAHISSAEAIICDLEPITRRVIDAAPYLKVIARRGVGVDSVDVAYAKEKGVAVMRTPGVVEAPVAELVMAYILAFSRKVIPMSERMHAGKWKRLECNSLFGKTLGIIGMGKIGMEVARRANAFGMHILYTDMVPSHAADDQFGAKLVSLDRLLANADFISAHVPLTENTKGLIGYDACTKMKTSAFLINTSRGGVVDESGLCRALEKHLIAGAAVDVYNHEPCTDSSLRSYSNVLLTPHIGTFTQEVFTRMDMVAAENIISFFDKSDEKVDE